jgi:CDP-diglyceride synthetase
VTNRQLVLTAALSAVFLTACDSLFHVRTDTLVYHWAPQVAGQTVIVPLTFFAACLAMLEASRRVQSQNGQPASPRAVVFSLGLVTAAYLTSGLLESNLAGAYALVLLVAWAARVAMRREPAAAVAVGVMIAAGGVLAESALSAAGEFDYLAPDSLGVPWWLFPLYLHGALVAVDVVGLVRLRTATGATSARRA